MANAVSYPKISRNIWSKLRVRFQKTIPAVVTPTYISSIVHMADASAVSNVIKPLQVLGLLDEQRKPTDLASEWRHDDDYAAVCKTIRERIYPRDLLDTYPDASPDERQGIIRWFMKSATVGVAAARMFADTYSILAQANVSLLEEKSQNTAPAKARVAVTKAARKSGPIQVAAANSATPEIPHTPNASAHHKPLGKFPAVHIDVQVHISPDTSPEQIDRIFESMAKHLGNFTG